MWEVHEWAATLLPPKKHRFTYTCSIYNTKAFFNEITLHLLTLFTVVPRYFLDRITTYGDAYLCTEAHPFQSQRHL